MKKTMAGGTLALLLLAAAAGTAQVGRKPVGFPDLVVSRIDFDKVKSDKDAQGNTYWIFNVIAVVKNQGPGNAGAFKVLLERNNGAGGSFQTACPTCLLDVGGLAAGQETALPPRQFNNAMGMPSRFRATADSGQAIAETNETNNSRTELFVSLTPGDVGGPVPLKIDLAVTEFHYANLTPYSDGGKNFYRFDLVATVKNVGSIKSGTRPFHFERSNDNKIFWPSIPGVGAMDTPDLAPGASHTFTAPGCVYEVGTGFKFYKANVNMYGYLNEADKGANNFKTLTLPVPVPDAESR